MNFTKVLLIFSIILSVFSSTAWSMLEDLSEEEQQYQKNNRITNRLEPDLRNESTLWDPFSWCFGPNSCCFIYFGCGIPMGPQVYYPERNPGQVMEEDIP